MQATITFDLSNKRQVSALIAALDSLSLSQPEKHTSIAAWENGLLNGKHRRDKPVTVASLDYGRTLKDEPKPTSRKGKAWSKADIAYLKANYNSMTAKQLADKLKRENPQSIYQAALRFGIVKPHLRVVA